MDTREAYDALHAALVANPKTTTIEGFYDETVFGNFWLTYIKDGERLSLVNDRGQLVLLDGPNLDELKQVLLQDLYSADQKALLKALG